MGGDFFFFANRDGHTISDTEWGGDVKEREGRARGQFKEREMEREQTGYQEAQNLLTGNQ